MKEKKEKKFQSSLTRSVYGRERERKRRDDEEEEEEERKRKKIAQNNF